VCRFNYPFPNIIIGSMALRYLYVGLDYEEQRVGFANKLYTEIDQSQEGCPKLTKCRGMQEYSSWNNECDIPNCKEYYFSEYDPVSGFSFSFSVGHFYPLFHPSLIYFFFFNFFFSFFPTCYIYKHKMRSKTPPFRPPISAYRR
jgi:hypothetical protein